jgi:hypothetical protein
MQCRIATNFWALNLKKVNAIEHCNLSRTHFVGYGNVVKEQDCRIFQRFMAKQARNCIKTVVKFSSCKIIPY